MTTDTGTDAKPQTIFRAAHGELPYFLMLRTTAQDSALSFEARGLVAYLLSKPNDWQINKADLMREGGLGRTKMKRVMDELTTTGYMTISQERGEGERFQKVVYTLHEEPQAQNVQADTGGTGNTKTAERKTRRAENDPQHNTESTESEIKQKESSLATQEQPAQPEDLCTLPANADKCLSLSKFGYTVGDVAWLVEDSEYHRTPTIYEVTVKAFTKHMVRIEFEENGETVEKLRRPKTLSKVYPKLERTTTPLQDTLAECLFSIPVDAPIGRQTMIDLQTYAGEILTPYPTITPEHVRAAFAWKGEFKPSKPSMVVKMLGDYRDHLVKTQPKNGADKPAQTFIYDPACTACTYGMVVDDAGKSVQCAKCAELKEKEIA